MHPDHFRHLTAALGDATPAQILELEAWVEHTVTQQFTGVALARRSQALCRARCCPHCASTRVVRHGKDANQRQRFRCQACRRTHNILTGTAMARARKPEIWATYLGFMTEHHSVRAIKATGIGLNHVTIWRWRQRFLITGAHDSAACLSGVIEAETVVFPYSRKGQRGGGQDRAAPAQAASVNDVAALRAGLPVAVLSALDSAGGVVQSVLGDAEAIETVLRDRIAGGSVLCCPDHPAYGRVADRAGAEVRRIGVAGGGGKPPLGPGETMGRLGLRRVRRYHERLMALVHGRCRGVATRYLQRYLGWHRAMARPGFAGTDLLTRALALAAG